MPVLYVQGAVTREPQK